MNRVDGTIISIKSEENLYLVGVEAHGIRFTSVLVMEGDHAKFVEGASITLLFKETEVVLGLPVELPISLRNRIPGTIESINLGNLLAAVTIRSDVGSISSIITATSVKNLDLKIGDEVIAMIKTNEMIISN